MKFSDGYWMMRAGVHASYPVQVLDAVTGPDSLVVYAPTQHIRDRGDMLKGPVVTLAFTSPMPDVIGVEMTHFAGEAGKEPQFRLQAQQNPGARAACDEHAATFTSGALSARVTRRGEWSVDFLGNHRHRRWRALPARTA